MAPKKSVNRKRKQIKEQDESELDGIDQDVEMKEEEKKEEQKAGEEEDQARKRIKQPRVILDSCSVCLNEFAASNDQLRLLPCLHSLCRQCGIDLINRNEQKNTLTCPECQQSHIFDHPNIEKDAAILIDRCPTYHQAWNRNERLRPTEQPPAAAASSSSSTSTAAATDASTPNPSAAVLVSKVFYCTVDGCTKLATHLCLGCGYQCAEHEYSSHLGIPRSSHIRVSLEEQRAKLKQEENHAANLKQFESILIKLDQIQSTLCADGNGDDLRWQEAEKSYRDGLDEEAKFLADLTTIANTLKQAHAYRTKLLPLLSTQFKEFRRQLSEAIDAKRDELQKLSVDERVRASEEDLKKLLDLSKIDVKAAPLKLLVESRPVLPPPHPMVPFVRGLKSPSLLPALVPKLKRDLQGMLAKSGKSLVNAALLYKGNWHGWTKDDFIRCCKGKHETLVLVKVGGNGYIFGAYIAPKWPALGQPPVPDPTRTSFIFSLKNRYGHPIRLSLTNPNSAIDTSLGSVGFGQQVVDANGKLIKTLNMVFFIYGRLGNDACGIYTFSQNNSSFAYQLDEESKRTAPNRFQLDKETFSASRSCGASEFEVYQL